LAQSAAHELRTPIAIMQAETEALADGLIRRFYRGRSGRFADGSGIGLAVVKELVDAHGGDLTIDEGPGGGARFTVRLPQVTAAVATG
jgi:signal transduction histidine kinase